MVELQPILDSTNGTPLYMQLYTYIKEEIANGHLKKGSKLPSIRVLSQHLAISKTTVETAYQQLLAEGYIESKPRVGFIVQDLEEPLAPQVPQIDVLAEAPKTNPIRYNFRYGHIDPDHFPLKTWRKCLLAAMDAERSEWLWYGDRQGDIDLREEIQRYLYHARGIHCSPEQIVIGSGTPQLIGLLCQLFDFRHDVVALENPCYNVIRTVFQNHHFSILPIELEEDGLNIDQLQATNAKVVYVTPSHQLPLGMVLPIGKRQKLLKWVQQSNGFIIEDDYDSEFRYGNKPIPALKALDTEDRVVYVGTFSKVFTPAIRASYMVLPQRLLARFYERCANYHQTVATIVQKSLALFMREGHFERHIRRMRTIYAKKRQALIGAIREHFGDQATIIGDKAGLHLLVEIKGKDAAELVQKAEKAGILVYSAAKYWFGNDETPPPYLLLGFGGMSEKDIRAGIRELKQVWEI
ncbi:MocR-like pyridoxine biosynthesis transcription factor PdxR [Saccharococcus thermophilus]|uniref:GntR family transcriptional regulator/MocR family aminotransferase n=1 Tax=Saccharococcus thermophilus TaxID=29396 RepID=A0A846MD36_9BACL|nr:PLP-dependent aminotransferase family protein [Saccharococcus thermophilus]NIK14921.1 GntR family transcriptional regulator/MocR family aminotransferase [Saccharococcus thermophilus]